MAIQQPNVLFISRAYGEHAGGMERLSFELLAQFPDSLRIVPSRKHRNLFISRLMGAVFALSVIPKALIKSRHADVLHIGDPVLLGVAWVVRVFRNIPVVCTVHGLDVSFSYSIYQSYLKAFLPTCQKYIAISDYAKNLLEQRGVAQEKITVIPPGIRDHIYDKSVSRQELSALLAKDIQQSVVLLTTGRLVKRKGHAWFIAHVLPLLPQNVVYVIAGDGPERERIAQSIATHNMHSRVSMLGRVSDADQKVLLNTCDAFVQPNISVAGDGEGFGIAPLEAALCARNVFASKIDGIPNAIHNGKNGTLVDADNDASWVYALTGYVEHPSVNMQAREYTKVVFNWSNIAEQYQRVLKSVV